MAFHTGRKLFAYGFLFGLGQMCFIPTGNYLRMVSCPAWHHGISYRQETVCVWFPIRFSTAAFHTDRKLPGEEISRLRFATLEMTGRRGADVFHDGRKLFAYGFLSDMAPMCFTPAGNCLRMVSCPAWDGCVSYRQETICVWFPIRLGTAAFYIDRKLFAKGFLFSLGRMCFIPTGNWLRRVSYPAWHHGISYWQETVCVWFPIRLGTDVFRIDRKLFAYGFLSDLAPVRFILTGNWLRRVSYSTWRRCASYRQETICVWFPTRHGIKVFHTGRKLFAYGFLFGLAPVRFISAGNYLRMVSYPAWHCCVSYRQGTIRVWFPVRHGTDVFHISRKLFAYGFLLDMASMCFIPTGNFLERRFLDSASLRSK